MTAKDFLSLYREAEEKILQNREKMLSAERRAWEICSRKYFEHASEFEDRLWEENEELACVMADIERTVGRLSEGNLKEVLWGRYIEGRKWADIAEKMCYSEQHIHRLHKKALGQVVVPMKYNADL